jgi:hypothetical protein
LPNISSQKNGLNGTGTNNEDAVNLLIEDYERRLLLVEREKKEFAAKREYEGRLIK